jgi:hypothetical protein
MRARGFLVGATSKFEARFAVAVAVGLGVSVGAGVGGTEVGVGMGSLMVGGGEIGGTLPSLGRAFTPSSGASFWSEYMLPSSVGRSELGPSAGTEITPSLEHATINVINARTPRRNTVRDRCRQYGRTNITCSYALTHVLQRWSGTPEVWAFSDKWSNFRCELSWLIFGRYPNVNRDSMTDSSYGIDHHIDQ